MTTKVDHKHGGARRLVEYFGGSVAANTLARAHKNQILRFES